MDITRLWGSKPVFTGKNLRMDCCGKYVSPFQSGPNFFHKHRQGEKSRFPLLGDGRLRLLAEIRLAERLRIRWLDSVLEYDDLSIWRNDVH